MWIADDSHEMSSLIFSEKYKMSSAAIVISIFSAEETLLGNTIFFFSWRNMKMIFVKTKMKNKQTHTKKA